MISSNYLNYMDRNGHPKTLDELDVDVCGHTSNGGVREMLQMVRDVLSLILPLWLSLFLCPSIYIYV